MTETESYKNIKGEIVEDIRYHWKALLFFAIVAILGGIGCLISPLHASVTIDLSLGISLIVMAIPLLVMSLKAPGQKHRIVAGTGFFVSLILGILILTKPGEGVILLAISIGAFFFIHGIAKIVMSFKFPSDADRAMATVSGALNILAGILVLKFTEDSSNNTDSIAAGVGLIFSGLVWVRLALRYRNAK